MNFLGYQVTVDYPILPMERQTIINTINPHSYCVAKRDDSFKKSLVASDVLLPDGIGIVWAAKVLYGKKIVKIAGFDIFLFLMRYLNETGSSCFFLGASDQTLNLIKERAKKEFSNVIVNTYSPPYKSEFSADDSTEMCRRINFSKPKVLFVGMTAPKQEKWVYANKGAIDAQIICSIGAVFDFYAGTVKRPNEFWIKYGLEWLPRFLNDPIRLAQRNLVSTPKFIWEVLTAKFFKGSKQKS